MFEPVKWPDGGLNTAMPPAVFRRYIDINDRRGLKEIAPGAVKTEPLYIVCSGPSLIDTWHEVKDHPGAIWALNSAFDWLCDRGIRPDYGLSLAPENEILNYFQMAGNGDRFLFGMQTHVELVDRVLERGGEVTFFHCAHPAEWELPAREPRVFGGGTIGSRSFDLAWILGYRDVHVLGLDACLSPDGCISVDTPMYDDRRADLKTFMVNGRAFVALPSHARQVEDFAHLLRHLDGMTVTLYGDGMLQWSQRRDDA